MFRPLIVMLSVLTPFCASAECGPDNAQIKLALSADALAVRNSLLAQLCSDGKGMAVDMTDPTLTGKFTPPRDLRFGNLYSNPGKFLGHLLLMFVVDRDGSIKQPTILISSGNRKLDEEIVRNWTSHSFRRPGVLDGRPVRVLSYYKYRTKVNGASD